MNPLDSKVVGIGRSPTLEINERSRDLQRRGVEVLKLGLGQSPFPVPDPVVAELQRHAHRKDYLRVEGLTELRTAVANHHRSRHGLAFDGDQILIGPGSKELLFLTQLALDAELLLPSPSWVSYEPQARILGRPMQWLPTTFEERWSLSAETLDHACQQPTNKPVRLLILNSPNNPTGLSVGDNQLRQIAEVAREHRLIVLSDEIYGELQFDGRHHSLAQFYPEGTLVSSGLSKWCGAGGWRLGTLAIPAELDWLRSTIAEVASETFTAVCAPLQYAAITAFEGSSEIDRYLDRQRQILGSLGVHLATKLRDSGARVHDPDGAFYLFVDLSGLEARLRRRGFETSSLLCDALLTETGVATLPGSCFGRHTSELSLRLSYVDFDGSELLEAVAERNERHGPESPLDSAFLTAHCGRTVRAIERMCAWFES